MPTSRPHWTDSAVFYHLYPLGCLGAPARNPFIPDVPTIGEQGVAGLDLPSWLAVLGPARLPPEIVARLNTMFRDALNSAPVREAIARGAYETGPSTPEELAAEMRTTYDRWGAMIRAIGFQKQ